MNKKLCYVTADSDPRGEWMEIEATSVFHAGAVYCGACAARRDLLSVALGPYEQGPLLSDNAV